MRIYRIETSDNRGCFRRTTVEGYSLVGAACNLVRYEGHDEEPSPKRHPAPRCDPALEDKFRPGIHYFGFDSVEQLLRWFDSEKIRRMMNTLGGKLVEYECEDNQCVRSMYQVMFEMNKAVRILERPIPVAS